MSTVTAQIQEIVCRHCNRIVDFIEISGHAIEHLGYVPEFEELPIHFIMQRQGTWAFNQRVRRLFVLALAIALLANLLFIFLPSRFLLDGNIVQVGWGDTGFPMPAVKATLDEKHHLPNHGWWQMGTFELNTGEVCHRLWWQTKGPWVKDQIPDDATGLFVDEDGGSYSLRDTVQIIVCR